MSHVSETNAPAAEVPIETARVRVGVIGLGKMGLSHLAMIKAHPWVSVDAVVDSTGYILDVLGKYTGLKTFTSVDEMLAADELAAVIIATPTSSPPSDSTRSATSTGTPWAARTPRSSRRWPPGTP